MRRICCAAALVLSLSAGVAAGGVTPASADPAPFYAAALVDDGACLFTLGATWRNAPVDHVFGSWYLDGTFLLTTEAPGTGPNAGVIRGHNAIMQAGAFAPDTAPHTWQVLVHYYSGSGELLAQVWTNVDNAACAVSTG
jgi:hypothetical protein